MSNDSTISGSADMNPQVSIHTGSTGPRRLADKLASKDVDHDLVNQTKKQIQNLVREIAELAKTDCGADEFYEGFLSRTASALASMGAAIWRRDSGDSPLQLQYQINLKQTGLADNPQAQLRHSMLLNRLLETTEPTLIAPQSGLGSEIDTAEPVNTKAGNPTDYLLLVGPLIVDAETVGLVEIFQRPGAGPTTQRGYLRFLTQMCEIASDYLRNQKLKLFSQQQVMWHQLEQFIRSVHRGLDTDQTVYTIANEGRRLLDCDRLSVAIIQGRQCRIKSVSGLDSIERRADQIKKLNLLATKVVRAGQPVWYSDDQQDLPPQIESRLHDYVDRAHTKMLAIVPLKESIPPDPAVDTYETKLGKPIGALIVEQLKDSSVTPAFRQRVDVVVEHSQTALTNSVSHNSVFLMPVWRMLGRLTNAFRGTNLIKTATVTGLLVATFAFLYLYQYPFTLGANGSLIPKVQHEIYAPIDGRLQEFLINDTSNTIVEKDQVLARLINNDLLVEIENMEGRLKQLNEQASTLRQASFAVDEIENKFDRIMLEGDYSDVRQSILNLENELQLERNKLKLLEIRSPARGQVVNWQARKNLIRRPVSRGQNLLTIIDPDTDWQIEIQMPERRVAHLLKTKNESDSDLKVTFSLVSHPGEEFTGRLISLDRQLAVHSEDGNATLARIEFDNSQIPIDLLRSGTRVTAKVHCGDRSIGYVVFHELIETIQSSFMLWF